ALRVLTQAVNGELAASGRFSVASSTAVAEECKADLMCHCRAARTEQADHALYGNVGRFGSVFSFELVLLDSHNCAVESSAFETREIDAGQAAERVAGLTQRLTTPKETISETVIKSRRDVDAVPATV